MSMVWIPEALGGATLLVVGFVLRRLLHLGHHSQDSRRQAAWVPLDESCDAVYRPIALEIVTQAAILGVSLDDAMEERASGHQEIAWRLVCLAASEWDQLSRIVTDLLNTMSGHMPVVRIALPVRGIVASRFKSRTMIDYVRAHELIDQFMFRSKLRFLLQIRALRRCTETLTAEFHRTYRAAQRPHSAAPEPWSQLDLYLHDFDLVTKETLLVFRTFLSSLPTAAVPALAADLDGLVRHGVRSMTASRTH